MFKIASLMEMVRRFGRDRRGNVLVMTGLAIVPLTGVVGVSVDYSRASNVRQALSSAIDAASLMAARDAQKLTDAQLRTRIDSWIRDNLPPDAKESFTNAVVTIDRTQRTIKIEANANMPTTIARVLGTQYIPVATNAQSTWGTNTIELALVLDNTGSMAQNGKMTALKTASKSLLKIMKDAAIDPDQIRISIVPFNTQVRIPRSFKDAEWMRYGMTRQVNCRNVTINGRKQQVCDTETMTKATWSTSAQGCIADRDQNYDTMDGGSYAASAQQYPAFWCGQSTLAEILPLTSNWTALESRVDDMTPVGATNVTIGAVWGAATLSPGAPYTEAKPATEPRLKKYMILLTDGDNTQNRFEGDGSTSNPNIDKRTELACTNIKDAGIGLYTIRVIAGNETLLRKCASTDAMYYNVQNASQLDPVFKAIANEISAVRLTH
ncbi:TadE/TadG family type IV pilus assembly protein [Bosea sp. BH3]|uniref:TadE/TadG family type IV pilus assembly protein n=1 Tax=Bosea sp. BH3 TaxID=2871701 RepID=UPI0021CB2798|nr:TadE/TadG family type IV pilus assembly protein [Bosea sp. BH3]MCU4177945.1 pilus assembly protein [Bosea sp. BH3]